MYLPSHFEEHDLPKLHSLIKAYPLGTLTTQDERGLVINHIPFLVDGTQGTFGILEGHVARANPVYQLLTSGVTSAVVFQGPQSYISPSWYPSKHEHHRAVPTWNYAVVHVHGTPNVVEDRAWLLQHITQLSAHHESHQGMPWQVSDAPGEYVDKMLGAIVGIKIPIARISGKWKLSQNRSKADQQGVIAGLRERGDYASMAMAELMESPNMLVHS